MLTFSRVPAVPASAPAGSVHPLGKVNGNAGWLDHLPQSVSISLVVPNAIWEFIGCVFPKGPPIYASHLMLECRYRFPILHPQKRGKLGVKRAPEEYVHTLAQGHSSRAGVC